MKFSTMIFQLKGRSSTFSGSTVTISSKCQFARNSSKGPRRGASGSASPSRLMKMKPSQVSTRTLGSWMSDLTKPSVRFISGAAMRRPSRSYTHQWYGHLKRLVLPWVSGGSSSHSSLGRSPGAVTHMPRCWHTDDITRISPEVLRVTISGSFNTVMVK